VRIFLPTYPPTQPVMAERFPLSHDSCRQPQTYVKPETVITVFELLMMSGVSLETYWAIKKHWNNKFYYTVASCWLFLYNLQVPKFRRSLLTPSSGWSPWRWRQQAPAKRWYPYVTRNDVTYPNTGIFTSTAVKIPNVVRHKIYHYYDKNDDINP